MTDFGPIKFIIESLMIPFLTFSYDSIFPNYGIAIILLTVVIKILFFPLMNKQYRSMKKMQEVAPEMTKLREKYKSKPEKLQQEVVKLYKQHNVNPLVGACQCYCKFHFYGIYATIMSEQFTQLLEQPEVNRGLFSFWLSDLAVADGTYILPIVLAIFTFFSQN